LAKDDARVSVISNPTGRTPNGLNAALKASRYEIVVRIDGHSEIENEYIKKAVATLKETNAVNVGGIMAAEGISTFQSAVARAMRSPIGVGASRFHVGGKAGPTDTVYLGVFRRSALQEINGYDERFVRAQDWEMNHRLRLNCLASMWIGKSFGERIRLPLILITMHFCWGFGFISSPTSLLPR